MGFISSGKLSKETKLFIYQSPKRGLFPFRFALFHRIIQTRLPQQLLINEDKIIISNVCRFLFSNKQQKVLFEDEAGIVFNSKRLGWGFDSRYQFQRFFFFFNSFDYGVQMAQWLKCRAANLQVIGSNRSHLCFGAFCLPWQTSVQAIQLDSI